MRPNAEQLVRIVLSTIVPSSPTSDAALPVPKGNLHSPITPENYSNLSNSENLFLSKSLFIDSNAVVESGVFQRWENTGTRAENVDLPVFRIYQFIVPREKSKIIDTLQGGVPPVAVYSHLGHDQDTAFGGISVREIYRVEFFGRPYQIAHRAYLLARGAFVKQSRISVIQGNIDDYDSDIRIWRKFLTISVR